MADRRRDTLAQIGEFLKVGAREEAAEIEDKAKEAARAQRYQDVQRGKAKIDALFQKKFAQIDTDARVARAKQKKQLDDSVLQKRVDALDSVREGAQARLRQIRSGDSYKSLLQQLTVQAAFVLEGDAKVRCRQEDKALINLAEAEKGAAKCLADIGRAAKPKLSWDTQMFTGAEAERVVGGVFLSLVGDKKITCDNTLAARLDTCLEEYAPVIRHQLFAERQVRQA
eukprot:TRINITY_DN17578_c0_g1_i1.p1 TRINITY_DN17578_c0_g1~~TRINITY_DN17578_c0_g1_i1.p1  ORF type:complete len:227 (+),score=93.61 TRINITY_DN17578_c0_g1_i1:102-782(+)